MKRTLLMTARHGSELGDPPRTLAEATYRKIREDIVWSNLTPGAPLRSDELRKVYGVGISPLREALSRLVAERLVTAVGQRGFRVAPLTPEDVLDIMETRLVIEGAALSRSIAHGDLQWETGLVASFHTLSRIAVPHQAGLDAEIWVKHHRAFHMSLIAACSSRWQLELALLLFDQAERHRASAMRIPQARLSRDANAEHKEILDATLARDAPMAIAALERHYRATAEQVVAAIRGCSSNFNEKITAATHG
jgi:GntR family transcriptional regulator, carbon starvation induced regulator